MFEVSSAEGPLDNKKMPQFYNRMKISSRAVEARFKVLLVPFRMGEEMPKIGFDAASGSATLAWKDQSDKLRFASEHATDQRTRFTVLRDDKTLLESK